MQQGEQLGQRLVALALFNPEDHPRGKTTPQSRGGSFAPAASKGKTWVAQLTPQERTAVKVWGTGYDVDIEGKREAFEAALKKAPVVSGVVFRGQRTAEVPRVGELITLPSHLSASVDRAQAEAFGPLLKQKPFGSDVPHKVVWQVDVRTARDIGAGVSKMYRPQREVLMRAGTRLKVTAVKTTSRTATDVRTKEPFKVKETVVSLKEV